MAAKGQMNVINLLCWAEREKHQFKQWNGKCLKEMSNSWSDYFPKSLNRVLYDKKHSW